MVSTQFDLGVQKADIIIACALFAILLILAEAKSVHYLFFHTMAEIFAIVVSFSIFILTWASIRYLKNGYLIVLGAAYGTIGFVDIFHTLTFRGMNLFPEVSTNYPTQFWLIARYLEAIAILCAPLVINRKPNFYYVSAGFASIGTIACIVVMHQWFPATFIDGVGLTPFKIHSEHLIIAMLIVGFFLLNRLKRQFEPRIFFLLISSLWLAVATEFCFTKYVGFYDFTNELGHYFRFLSVALAFIAIVLSGVRRPFELIFREVDELNRKLSESENRYRSAFHASPDAININRLSDGRYLDLNEAFMHITGWSREEIIGKTTLELGIWHDQNDRQRMVDAIARDGHFENMEARFVMKDGATITALMSAHVIAIQGEQCVLSVTRDISERKSAEAKIYELAFHDSLTHLPNRRLLNDRLSQAMLSSKRSSCYGAVMFLDLDNFKSINDTHGHEVGDLLLVEAANRLKSCLREIDTVARFGGDEFVVVIGDLDVDITESTKQASIIAEKIRSILSNAFRLTIKREGKTETTIEHHCTTSLGIVLFINHDAGHDDLFKWADVAMYQAKDAGRNAIRFYEPKT